MSDNESRGQQPTGGSDPSWQRHPGQYPGLQSDQLSDQPASAPDDDRPIWAGSASHDSATQTTTAPGYQPYSAYGGYPPPTGPAGTAQVTPRTGRTRGVVVVATALIAGLVGGGAGAAGAWALADGTNAPVASGATAPLPAAPISAITAGSVSAVASRVLPSVVSITAQNSQGAGTGTGVVLDTDGHILTNNHVVVPSLSGGKLTVTLNDGRTATAKLVGRDPTSDLAVIKVSDVKNLTPAKLGNSGSLVVGQSVVAIGSPLGLSGTVTSGIVSALDRPVRTQIEDQQQQQQQQDPFGLQNPNSQSQSSSQATVIDAIQTDAAINPGNSGGPLVDMAGNVVGINSSIASLGSSSGGQSGSIGLGFSIPIDIAKPIISQLMSNGKATHALLGVTIGDASNSTGATVRKVTSGGAAHKAGLRSGDVITKVGSRKTPDSDSVIAAVRSYRPGDTVNVTVLRGGDTKTLSVTLGSD